MNITIKLHDIKTDFDVIEITIPGKYEVCPRCDGSGKHVNPAIDGNGLSSEDFAEDPDFKEAYFSGAYDVICSECHGKRVVPIPDVAQCTYAQKRLLVSERIWQREEQIYLAEIKAEQRMMC